MSELPSPEHLLSGVADGIDEVVVLLDSQDCVRTVLSDTDDPPFFNTDHSQVTGQTLWDVFTDARAQRFSETIADVLEQGESQTLNCQIDTEHGIRHFAGTVSPVGGHDTQHALWIARDATPQRRREHQQKLLDRLFEVTPFGLVLVEPSGDISEANERAEAILGLERSEITSRTYRHTEWRITYEDGTPVPDDEHPVTRTLETGEPVLDFEHWIELPDGSKRWLSSHAAPVVDDDGQVQRVVVGLDDATQQKKREQRLEWLLESDQLADIGGWELDCETEVVESTAGMSSFHGNGESRLSLADALDMYHPDDRGRVETALRACREDGTPFDIEGRRQTADGRERWVRIKGEPIERQGVRKVRGIVRDITVSKEREQRLKVMNRVLRHNIRNRLNIIVGHAELIRAEFEPFDASTDFERIREDILPTIRAGIDASDELDADVQLLDRLFADLSTVSVATARESVNQIKTSSEKLITLADKVRQFDEAIENSSEASPVDADIGELVADITREYREQYPNSEITTESAPVDFLGNPEAVRLVISIAVENALEHNDASTPVVSLTVAQPAEEELTVVVEDNGPGIPDVEKDVLNGAGETPTAHSSGVGLWTMQWLLRRLGGEVTVSTDDVVGTRLELTLPTTPENRDAAGSEPST